MATSGKSLAITTGIYSVVALLAFIFFSWWRTTKLTKKFFSPKLYVRDDDQPRPPPIKRRFGAWVPRVLYLTEAEIIRYAGVDAAVYLKILRMGFEIFLGISFLVLVIILPINVTGSEVDKLMSNPTSGTLSSNPLYQYLVPNGTTSSTQTQQGNAVDTLPTLYADPGGDPPAGMLWWRYADNIDPLAYQTPEQILGPNYSTYGWRWDQSYQQLDYKFTSLDKTTISNVSPKSARLWAHAIITWVISFFIYYWLWKYNKEGLRLRIFYLLNQPPGAESHTVLVQDVPAVKWGTIPQRADGTVGRLIPKSLKEKAVKQAEMLAAKSKRAAEARAHAVGERFEHAAKGFADIETAGAPAGDGKARWEMRDAWADAVSGVAAAGGSVEGMVEAEFRRIYGDDLSAVHMCHNTQDLDPLVAEYEKLSTACTDLVDNYISLKRRGKELKPKKVTVIGATMGAWGREKYGMKPVKVDAFEFYRDRLVELRRAILEEQDKAREPANVFPAAFVTFNRRTSQVVAARTLMSEDLSAWRCQGAPRAEELVWGNLGFRVWERSGRSLAMYSAFIALCAFYMIPVAAVQGLLSLNSFLSFVNSIPVLGALLTGMLPGLALKVFLALMPMIITAMNKFAGMVSVSQIDLGLVTRFFYFQVITLFLGSFIAGTFANQLKQFINDPGSIINILGTSAPQTAIFFLTYLLLEALLTSSMNLLRIIPLIIFWVKSRFLAGTERAKARLWQNQTMTYGTVVPNDTIAFLLGLVFCCICPLIAPVVLAYFAFNYTVWKYQQVYVYTPAYQSGGLVWMRAFDQCMLGMIIFHLLMVGILGLKKSIGAPIFVFILFAFDFVFWAAVHARFWRPQECLSLISAAEMDAQDGARMGGQAAKPVNEEIRQRYLSPSFKFSEEEHARTLDEAGRMAAVLAGGEDEKLFAQPDEDAASSIDEAESVKPSPLTEGPAAAADPSAPAADSRVTAAVVTTEGEAYGDASEYLDASSINLDRPSSAGSYASAAEAPAKDA